MQDPNLSQFTATSASRMRPSIGTMSWTSAVLKHATFVDAQIILLCTCRHRTGCAQACRMCHLTASRQTRVRDASFAEIIEQAATVLDYYRQEAPPARIVHFNFMARGNR